jgi:hypothetical protein
MLRPALSALFASLLATLAAADPSTTSIETGTMGGLEARFVVAPSDERHVADRDWRYWVVMPNTSARELRIELDEISFAGPARGSAPVICSVADCFGVFRPLRIDPSETLLVASNREILSLTLSAPDESGAAALPTLVGLYADCIEAGALMEEIFSDYRGWTFRTRVAFAPFPAVPDIGLSPVCIH